MDKNDKRNKDFAKIKTLLFNKELRKKLGINDETFKRLLREYSRKYKSYSEDRYQIRESVCDISNLDGYIKENKIEIQKDDNGQLGF